MGPVEGLTVSTGEVTGEVARFLGAWVGEMRRAELQLAVGAAWVAEDALRGVFRATAEADPTLTFFIDEKGSATAAAPARRSTSRSRARPTS